MTGSEVAVFRQSASAVVSTVREIVESFRATSVVNAGKLDLLREKNRLALAAAHSLALSHLFEVNLNEIAKASRLIAAESHGASSYQVRAMMSQLDILSHSLDRNLRQFAG